MDKLIAAAATDEECEDINRKRILISRKMWYIDELCGERVER